MNNGTKISELPSLETLADNDILAGVDTSEDTTSKITLEKIKNYATEDVYDKEEVDDTIDTLQTQINSLSTIYNAFPTVSDEGESMTLDDTAEVTFKKLDLKGNTSQYTATGKNKFDYLTSDFQSGGNGSVDTSTKNTIKLTCTTTTSNNNLFYRTKIDDNLLTNGATYTISYVGDSNVKQPLRLQLRNKNGSNAGLTVNTSVTYDDTYSLYVVGNPLAVNNNTTVTAGTICTITNLQVEQGTTATNYEEFVGGVPSPSPSYPQQVNVVSGDNTINICGKNLFDIQKLVKGRLDNGVINYPENTTSLTLDETSFSFTINNNYRGVVLDYTNIGNETNITFNSSSSRDGNSYKVACYDSDKNYLGDATFTTPTNYTILYTLLTNTKFIRMHILLNSVGSTTITNPMLLKGHYTSETIPTYEPYIGHSYPIYLGVENLFGSTMNITNRKVTITKDSSTIGLNGTGASSGNINNTSNTFTLEAGTYTMAIAYSSGTLTTNGTSYVRLRNSSGDSVITGAEINITSANYNNEILTATFTLSQKTTMYLSVYVVNGSTYNNLIYNAKINKGSTPQHTSTQPIELCKIGTYQDYIYKDNGSWYLHKEIKKVVLNGTESWTMRAGSRVSIDLPSIDGYYVAEGLCDKFKYIGDWDTHVATNYSFIIRNGNWGTNLARISFIDTDYTTVTAWKQYVAENNITVYYQLLPKLGGATNTLIEDTTLIEQLEALKLANSYEGQTNISQENNDKPFILDVDAIKKLT